MIKTLVSYTLILFGLLVLYVSNSRQSMQYIYSFRDTNTWWGIYQFPYGDLVGMAYLDKVKKFRSYKTQAQNYAGANKPRNIVLYLHGDSYTRHLRDSSFACVSEYHYIDRNKGARFSLDTGKYNVLLIEISERYVRDYFGDRRILRQLEMTKSDFAPTNSNQSKKSMFEFQQHFYFNKLLNQNLQFNLFNYNYFMPVFQTKAAMNYYMFKRASGDVVISDNNDFLFLKETTTDHDIGSSYIYVDNSEIENLVGNFNQIYKYYKSRGFKEVYLSIIPNNATVMQPHGYNELIPRIQNDPRLKMKIIDMYTVYRHSDDLLVQPGDTHWNGKGRQKWIDLVNATLINEHRLK